jgi:regulatory protein YycI of two-component signal transduction system YycFG
MKKGWIVFLAISLILNLLLVWFLFDNAITRSYSNQSMRDLNRDCLALAAMLKEASKNMKASDLEKLASKASVQRAGPNKFLIKNEIEDGKQTLSVENVIFKFGFNGGLSDIQTCLDLTLER